MKFKQIAIALFSMAVALAPKSVEATKFLDLKVIDKDYLMVHFRDGEVRYRDNGTGKSAYLGHTFVEGDDTLVVFGKRLDTSIVAKADTWKIASSDDKTYGTQNAVAVWRKSKPMNTDNTLTSELDHWIFLKLPQSMKQGCTYSITIPNGIGADKEDAEVKFDIWSSQSESVHVNLLGYTPQEKIKAADLYYWLGDGGQRDYSSFEGKKVYLYNVNTGKKSKVGQVKFWKSASEYEKEANKKNMTGSDVWNIDFKATTPGRYRLVVEDVGCSMDFDINNNVYFQPFHYSVRGYYYMRLGNRLILPLLQFLDNQCLFPKLIRLVLRYIRQIYILGILIGENYVVMYGMNHISNRLWLPSSGNIVYLAIL